jgi:predicted phage gp36 major capsid-like protein
LSKKPQSKPAAAKAKATEPVTTGTSEANAELLRMLDATTRQSLDRLQEISASTSKLIADMTRDALDRQAGAMERTAAAAERLLRPRAEPAVGAKAANDKGSTAGKSGKSKPEKPSQRVRK